jgi:hypothetical protein
MWGTILCFGLAILFSGCDGDLHDLTELIVSRYSTPEPTLSHESGATITSASELVISFGESMNVGTMVIAGDLGLESDSGSWTSTSHLNDTLTIRPREDWSSGSERTLSAFCEDTQGFAVEIAASYAVLDGVVYVDATKGSDSYPGTHDRPKASITEAVSIAALIFETAEIHVAEGEYVIPALGGRAISPPGGISLLGGYSTTDWLVHDPALYETRITDERVTPDPFLGINTLFSVQDAMDRVIIDGFTLVCNPTAVYSKNSLVTISNNIIEFSGSATDDFMPIGAALFSSITMSQNEIRGTDCAYMVGVVIHDSKFDIHHNLISCGNAESLTAVQIFDSPGGVVHENTIHRGTATTSSSGLQIVRSQDIVVRNNVIDGSTAEFTGGILVLEADIQIQNNTVDAGSGSGPSGLAIALGLSGICRVGIDNNILYTSGGSERYGLKHTGDAFITSFRGNLIFSCAGTPYYDAGRETTFNDVAAIHAHLENVVDVAGAAIVGNIIDTEPYLAPDNLSFTDQTPISITQGGLNLADEFTTDILGAHRFEPWSIGAYEGD